FVTFVAKETSWASWPKPLPRPHLLAGGREDVVEAVISLVAGELVHRVLRVRHRQVERPRFRPRRGIGDGDLVDQRAAIGAREFFDEARVLAAVEGSSLGSEVRGLDDQRLAFPVAARVP